MKPMAKPPPIPAASSSPMKPPPKVEYTPPEETGPKICTFFLFHFVSLTFCNLNSRSGFIRGSRKDILQRKADWTWSFWICVYSQRFSFRRSSCLEKDGHCTTSQKRSLNQ